MIGALKGYVLSPEKGDLIAFNTSAADAFACVAVRCCALALAHSNGPALPLSLLWSAGS